MNFGYLILNQMCSDSKIYTFIKKNGNFFHFRLTQRWVFDIFFLKWGRKPHNYNCCSYAANAVPVAAYAVAQIVLSLKRFWLYAFGIKRIGAAIKKDEAAMPGGYGTTVGLVSLGMIGSMVAERLKNFDLNVVAYDPFASQEKADALGVKLVELDELFKVSDVVSLHQIYLQLKK